MMLLVFIEGTELAEAERFTNKLHKEIGHDSLLYSVLEQIKKLFFEGQAFPTVSSDVLSETDGAMMLLLGSEYSDMGLLKCGTQLYFSVWSCWRKKKLQKTDLVREMGLKYQINES